MRKVYLLLFFLIFSIVGCNSTKKQSNLKHTVVSDPEILLKVESGDIEAVNSWLAEGNNVNTCSLNGKTLLHYAINSGNQDMIKTILSFKPDCYKLTTAYAGDWPPFFEANSPAIVQLLLDSGFDINCTDSGGGNMVFHCAVTKNMELLDFLILNGADVCSRTSGGWDILMKVAGYTGGSFDYERSKYFLEKGADATNKTDDNGSALLIAANVGNTELVKLLHNHGSDINIVESDYGWTPFLWACSGGNLELAEYLYENGADIYAESPQHGNAWTLAEKKGHQAILNFLLKL